MKKNFTLTALLTVLIGLNAIGQIPNNGLIGYWPFNGDAKDESGNANNGIVNGTTLTTDRFGVSNKAYYFDGVTSYIDIPNSTSLNITGKISVCAWLKTSGTGYCSGFLMKINHLNPTDGFLIRINNYNDSLGEFIIKSGGVGQRINSAYKLTDDKWHFIVGTYDGDSIYFYNDGIKVSSAANTSGIGANAEHLIIGYDMNTYLNNNRRFTGSIDDIRIYNRNLTPSEINTLYHENICYQTVTVTDTLFINTNITSYNPIIYQNNIKIYPNPTFDQITIDCGSNYSTLDGYTIKITNSLSQTVYESLVTKQTETIDLKTWTGKGIYFVHLIDSKSNTIDIKKIVLQ